MNKNLDFWSEYKTSGNHGAESIQVRSSPMYLELQQRLRTGKMLTGSPALNLWMGSFFRADLGSRCRLFRR
jgi:hypothetical protein